MHGELSTTSAAGWLGPDPLADMPDADHRTSARRRHANRGSAVISLNLTSMIDVVFLLLVYFMTATNFKVGEELYRMDIPARGVAAAPDPFQLENEPLRIRVATTGRIDSAYRLRLEPATRQPANFEQLHEQLHSLHVDQGGWMVSDDPIIIEPTATTRWLHTMAAYNAAARAKYTNITFGAPGG
jgi:biopolymer transport protein ExbD